MPPPDWRAHDSGDRSIRVRTLRNGDFLVNVVSGGVTMAIVVPPAAAAFLFS
jgi:hypothetical protein